MRLATYLCLWQYVILLAAHLPCTSSRALLPRSQSPGGGKDVSDFFNWNKWDEDHPMSSTESENDSDPLCTGEQEEGEAYDSPPQPETPQPELPRPFQISTYPSTYPEGGSSRAVSILLNEEWNQEAPFKHTIHMNDGGFEGFEGVIAVSTSGVWVEMWDLELANRIIPEGDREERTRSQEAKQKGKEPKKQSQLITTMAYHNSIQDPLQKAFQPFLDVLVARNWREAGGYWTCSEKRKAQVEGSFKILGTIPVTKDKARRPSVEKKDQKKLLTAVRQGMNAMISTRGILATSGDKHKDLLYENGPNDISIELKRYEKQVEFTLKVGDGSGDKTMVFKYTPDKC